MNREEALSKVLDIYPQDAFERNKGITFINFLISLLYDNGLVIVPVESFVTASDLEEFEQTLLAWNANENVEQSDINGEAIVHALKERGWVIQPPK